MNNPSPETLRVIAALDTTYPPSNPAVLLAAARDAYLNGIAHRYIGRLLIWTLECMATNVPDEFSPEQRDAVASLYFAGPVLGYLPIDSTPDEPAWVREAMAEGLPA